MIACFALHAAAVDPDELLRGVAARLSFRSALTAALATRLVAGARARRAAACATPSAAGRAQPARRGSRVLRAVTAGALDRAVDVAATLEVRGFGARRRARRGAAAVVAPRPRVRRVGASRWPRSRVAAAVGGWDGSRRTRASCAPLDGGAARARRGARCCARCCRSPTAGGSGDERAARSTRVSVLAIRARSGRRCATCR